MIKFNLNPNEQIVLIVRKHWIAIVGQAAALIFVTVIPLIIFGAEFSGLANRSPHIFVHLCLCDFADGLLGHVLFCLDGISPGYLGGHDTSYFLGGATSDVLSGNFQSDFGQNPRSDD